MFTFDADNTVEDFLASPDEVDLLAKQWRFKQRVNDLMNHHNRLREHAEAMVETVIRTKETNNRCACGTVADFVVKVDREIVCGDCVLVRKIPQGELL